MKIAIPVYNGNVSNVFDFANRLLIVEFADGKEIDRFETELDKSLPIRAGQLESHGIDVVVCGAVSQLLANIAAGLGLHRNAVIKYIEELLRGGKIEVKSQNQRVYYKAVVK